MLKTISCVLFLSAPAIAGSLDAPVVGGTQAKLGEWPDVALVAADDAACTGTLIAPDVVLTAGHCIEVNPKAVLLGSVDYAKPGGELIAVKSATAYPDWQHTYDVGVLVLDHAASAKPRAIASGCRMTPGMYLEVVGFGLTTEAGTGDNTKLNEAQLRVIDPMCTETAACASAVAPGGEFTAGDDGVDSCFGDSGGPLFAGKALLGVVSRGAGTDSEPCGGEGVYVRADKVVSWIEKTTGAKLARASCDGKADGEDGSDASDDGQAGGCSAGGGAIGAGVLAFIVALWILTIPRRREARQR